MALSDLFTLQFITLQKKIIDYSIYHMKDYKETKCIKVNTVKIICFIIKN